MVWGGICGQQQTDFIVTDGNLTTHRYLHMLLKHVVCGQLYLPLLLVLLYGIAHFTPSAVVNYIILGVFIKYTHAYLSPNYYTFKI